VDAVQIRPDSSDIGRRRWRILWLPGELSRGAGVWSVLLMCSSIDVHEFPSTLVCAHVPGSQKKIVLTLGKWKTGFMWPRWKKPHTYR
jgi:hypothetical protein